MFVINPKRTVKFHHVIPGKEATDESSTIEPVEFSVTFRFTASEDIDYVTLQSKLADKTPMEIEDEKTGKVVKKDMGTYNAFLYSLRVSLFEWEGIVDIENNPIMVRDEKGKIIEENQIAVFEAVRNIPELFNKVVIAYVGEKEKN